jgi:DNA-binding Lrp family transcriptional regulator
MTEMERRIIRELQHDLPIVAKPFAIVAAQLNISESELIAQIQSMLARGMIRKIGAVLRHRRVGFKANALCVWQVPQEKISAIGNLFAALAVVTHCYERQAHADWPYNLYTMVHALSKEECEEHIDAMRSASGIDTFQVFYSTQELKKTSMRYFE